MLTPVQTKVRRAAKARFAIVASQYNGRYVDAMVRAAEAVFHRARTTVEVVRVPGAYEIPVVVSRLARLHREAAGVANGAGAGFAIICLGVILRGETVHAAHIGEAVSRALMTLQLRYEVPVVHEVLLLENEAQAKARCLGRKHNRGTEAAQTALAMVRVMAGLEKMA